MRRLALALLVLGWSAVPAVAQPQAQGQLSQLPAIIGPNGGLQVECVGTNCGGVATGPGIDIVSVGGIVLPAGGPVPVSFGGSLPAGANTIGAVNLAQYTPNLGRLPVLADITGSVAVTGTFWQLTQPVSLASVPSHNVTNAGAFAVQATLAAETTKVIGTVNQGTSPWTVNLITGFALAATQTDRSQKTQLTDGTRDGTVKAASTLPLLTDTAVVTTQRDPLPAGTNVLGALANNQSVQVTTTSAGPTALGALDAQIPIALEGRQSLGFDLLAGTLAGTITFEMSADGGVTYPKTASVVNLSTGFRTSAFVFTNPNAETHFSVLLTGPYTHARVRVSAYTSGTANMRATAGMFIDAFAVGALSTTVSGSPASIWLTNIAGKDATGNTLEPGVRSGTPSAADAGLAVREVQRGQQTMAASIPFTWASDQSAIPAPTLTKGTQSATGFSTQDLKDAGRTIVTLTAERVVPVLTTDTIVTCAKLVGDTATAGVTTYAVTSGKTLRLQAIHISLTPSSTTLGVIQVRLRTLSSGACTVAAGLKVAQWEIGNPGTATQVANAANERLDAFFPDGLEFSGATRNICLSMNAIAAAAQVVTISLVGYEY